ncbi:hypothetical protein LTR16_009324, partial [Cryomyces antarcticus]
MEHDAARVSSSISSHLPGKEKEVKTEGKLLASEAGAKVDNAIATVKDTTSKVDAKLEAYRNSAEMKIEEYKREAEKDLHNAVDTFDKTVEEKAAKAKSGLSS